MHSPDALLMDLGNVLIKVDAELIRQAVMANSLRGGDIDERAFMETCGLYESGLIDSDSFLEQLGELTGLVGAQGRETLKKSWNCVFPPNPVIDVTVNACAKLKAMGVRLVLFSNTNEIHIDHMIEEYPGIMSLFDEAVYSHIVKGMKPHPPMYLEAIEKLGMTPERTLYFDDKPENVEGGRRFGFKSHVFDYTKPNTFTDRLPASWL